MKRFFPGLLIIISLLSLFIITVVLQNKQNLNSRASSSTALSFFPVTSANNALETSVDNPVSFDIMLEPRANHVSIVRLQIEYKTNRFQARGNDTLKIDPSAFSTIIEGPILDDTQGQISVTLAVGTDPTQAIKQLKKIATLNLIAKQETENEYTVISFTTETQAYSVSPNDHAYENVLSTASPAYIHILPAGQIPPPTATPTLALSPTPSTPPTPSAPPPPTPTPLPNDTVLSFNALLHSIGSSGDSTNPTKNDLSNKQPLRTNRKFAAEIYSASNQPIASTSGTLIYSPSIGNYTGTMILPNTIPTGDYIVKLKADSFLRKRIDAIYTISPAIKIILPVTTLVAGDIQADNVINILDYNQLMTCYSDLATTSPCDTIKKTLADLNDDGSVNHFDYNLFIREILVQTGE